VQEKIKTLTISGMGGAGKTTLAKMYGAEGKLHTAYDHVFYIKSANTGKVSKQYRNILSNLGVLESEKISESELVAKLNKTLVLKNWLIIYDNLKNDQRVDTTLINQCAERGHIIKIFADRQYVGTTIHLKEISRFSLQEIFKKRAVSTSKCNNVKFIFPVSFKVKDVFWKKELCWTFPA
jgi:adenylate kinase family enzyme